MRIDGPQITGSLNLNNNIIGDLESLVTTSSLNTFTSSVDTIMGHVMTTTHSLNTFTSSVDTIMGHVMTTTHSLNEYTSSTNNRLNLVEGVTGSYATTGSNLFKGTQTISGSIIPAVDNTYDLGSVTHQFRDLYLSSASLYIDGTKVLGSTAQELQITTDTGQSFKILEAGSDTITLQSNDGNITLATSGGGDVILDPTSGIIALKGTTTLYAGNRILTSDGNAIQFGNSVTMTGSLIVTGYIETQELRTTYISSSVLYRSGSTKFGDELTDTHEFTGSLSVSGSISFPAVPLGSSETNILLVNNNGNVVYRNNLSLTGAQGNQGPTGLQGTTGAQGNQGPTGLQGFQGNQGPTGLQGTTGAQGNQGPTGLQGTTGAQGNQGPTGLQGTTGAQGNQGPTGLQGTTGAQGNQGPTGLQGTTGAQGNQGPTGLQGFQGNQGPTGLQGTTGAQGNQGPTGLQGTTGAQGNQGPTGLQGTTGASAGITSYTNPADNRILTSVNSTTINAESNLTFDGTTLSILGGTSQYFKIDTSGLYGYIHLKAGTNEGYLLQNVNGGTNNGVTAGAMYLYMSNSQNFEFSWAGTTRVLFTSAGNVGIGTTGPVARVHAVNNNFNAATNPGFLFEGYQTSTSTTVPLFEIRGNWEIAQTSNIFKVHAYNDANGFNILHNGRVGIGTTSPSSTLHVNGTATFSTDARSPIFYDSNNTGYYIDPAGTSNIDRLLIRSNTTSGASAGVLNLGTTDDPSNIANANIVGITWGLRTDSQAYYMVKSTLQTYGAYTYNRLDLSWHTGIIMGASPSYGGIRMYNNSLNVANAILFSVGDGDNNTRSYYDVIAFASDERLKHKIKPIDNALSKVMSLNGMTFEWNDVGKEYGWIPSNDREVGLFAQDVQKVLPEAVRLAPFDQTNDEHGDTHSKSGNNFLTVKYEKIIPLLIESIKEQQHEINTLNKQITFLMTKKP